MARSGSRASRRMSRNNRAVSKLLRRGVGKQKRQPKLAARREPTEGEVRRAKGKRIRNSSLSENHRSKISAGLKRYWRSKKKRGDIVNTPNRKLKPRPLSGGRVSKPIGLNVTYVHGLAGY